MNKRVAVIGSGLIGMLSAIKLKQAGLDVTLFGPSDAPRASKGLRVVAVFHEKKGLREWMKLGYKGWDDLNDEFGIEQFPVTMIEICNPEKAREHMETLQNQGATASMADVPNSPTVFENQKTITVLGCSKFVNIDEAMNLMTQALDYLQISWVKECVTDVIPYDDEVKVGYGKTQKTFEIAVLATASFSKSVEGIPGSLKHVEASSQPYFIIKSDERGPSYYVKDNVTTARYIPNVDGSQARIFFGDVGESIEAGSMCPDVLTERARALQYLQEHFPCYKGLTLDDLETQHCWYTVSSDWCPIVGPSSEHSNVFMCVPPAGGGVKMAPIMVKSLVDAIVREEANIFPADRFSAVS